MTTEVAAPTRRTQAAYWAVESRRVQAEIEQFAAVLDALTDLANDEMKGAER